MNPRNLLRYLALAAAILLSALPGNGGVKIIVTGIPVGFGASLSGVPTSLTVGTPVTVSVVPSGWATNDPTTLVIWEASNQSDVSGYGAFTFSLNPSTGGAQWLEAEVNVGGRRLYLDATYNAAQNVTPQIEDFITPSTANAWFPLDSNYVDNITGTLTMTPAGAPTFDQTSWVFSHRTNGGALKCGSSSDGASVTLPSSMFPGTLSTITVRGMMNITAYLTSGQGTMLSIAGGGSLRLAFHQDVNNNHGTGLRGVAVYSEGAGYGNEVVSAANAQNSANIPIGSWYEMRMVINSSGYSVYIGRTGGGETLVGSSGFAGGETLSSWTGNNLTLQIGQQNMWIKDVTVQVN